METLDEDTQTVQLEFGFLPRVAAEEPVRPRTPPNGAGRTDGAGEILVGDSVAPASSKAQ